MDIIEIVKKYKIQFSIALTIILIAIIYFGFIKKSPFELDSSTTNQSLVENENSLSKEENDSITKKPAIEKKDTKKSTKTNEDSNDTKKQINSNTNQTANPPTTSKKKKAVKKPVKKTKPKKKPKPKAPTTSIYFSGTFSIASQASQAATANVNACRSTGAVCSASVNKSGSKWVAVVTRRG